MMFANLNNNQAEMFADFWREHPGGFSIENGEVHGRGAALRVVTFSDGHTVAIQPLGHAEVITEAGA